MSNSQTDLERAFYLAAAGLTETQAASMTIGQLRAAYIAAGVGSGGGGGGTLTDASIRTAPAVNRWDGSTGSQPLRSVATADTLRPVIWRQPTPPPYTTGYAIAILDTWENRPG